jgi:hypothetical protein
VAALVLLMLLLLEHCPPALRLGQRPHQQGSLRQGPADGHEAQGVVQVGVLLPWDVLRAAAYRDQAEAVDDTGLYQITQGPCPQPVSHGQR